MTATRGLERRCMLDEAPARSAAAPLAAGLGAAVLHAGLVLLALSAGSLAMSRSPSVPVPTSEMFDIDLAPPPEPPPPEPEPEAEPEPEPPSSPQLARAIAPRAAPRSREAPPPAAAQAGQVLTAADEFVDFGDTFVSGTSASYAGGTTEAGGTSTRAVRDVNALAGGVAGGTGTELGADLSRAPALAGAGRWDCPFPDEADEAMIDHAVVSLRVEVAADGSVESVRATSDPGYGFAREARQCAMGRRWSPGLDRAGRPAAAVALVNVRFDR